MHAKFQKRRRNIKKLVRNVNCSLKSLSLESDTFAQVVFLKNLLGQFFLHTCILSKIRTEIK